MKEFHNHKEVSGETAFPAYMVPLTASDLDVDELQRSEFDLSQRKTPEEKKARKRRVAKVIAGTISLAATITATALAARSYDQQLAYAAQKFADTTSYVGSSWIHLRDYDYEPIQPITEHCVFNDAQHTPSQCIIASPVSEIDATSSTPIASANPSS